LKKNYSLIPKTGNSKQISDSIKSFSIPLSKYLNHLGLPTENIVTSIEERRKVIFGLPEIIESIPSIEKSKSNYLSKFSVAVAAGLFDGALNYLWNQTILSLYRNIISFDLGYFFSVAEALNQRYARLSTEEHLRAISDHDLLEICRRIGIFSETIHRKLETVNYFRNHESAAHPNENEISGSELLAYLEQCIKYVIRGEFDHSVIKIKVLFNNIRALSIPDSDLQIISSDLIKQPKERLEDFGNSLFGLYCDVRQNQSTIDNIEKIFPLIWEAFSEEVKYSIGSKYGVFRKNGETQKKDLAERLLSISNGLSYRDEDSLAQELIEKLQELKSVHFQNNNFYNEYSYALSLEKSLPNSGIPNAAKKDFVKVISICYIGNGKGYYEGVDERALTYYEKFIKRFQDEEIHIFLKLFKDIEFRTDHDKKKPIERIKKIATIFKKRSQNIHIKNCLDIIIKSLHIYRIGDTGEFERAIAKIK
jgi:hypothetical protein